MSLSHRERGRLGALAARTRQQEDYKKRLACYAENPKQCRHCNGPIPYEKRHENQYCSHRCAAITNNTGRTRTRAAPRLCLCCGVELKDKQRTYCGVRCQQKLRMLEAVKDGSARSRTMKRWLIDQHGERCMDPACAWDFEKRPIGVEMDHKDGNAENNTPENVWLLCPNCHSTTPTYKNRNKGNGRAFRRERYRAGISF